MSFCILPYAGLYFFYVTNTIGKIYRILQDWKGNFFFFNKIYKYTYEKEDEKLSIIYQKLKKKTRFQNILPIQIYHKCRYLLKFDTG